MKFCSRVVLVLTLLLANQCLADAPVVVEAESFDDYGGWSLDTQFVHIMGSPYLLAHGLGEPVKNATTAVKFPATGNYKVWVRTKGLTINNCDYLLNLSDNKIGWIILWFVQFAINTNRWHKR